MIRCYWNLFNGHAILVTINPRVGEAEKGKRQPSRRANRLFVSLDLRRDLP